MGQSQSSISSGDGSFSHHPQAAATAAQDRSASARRRRRSWNNNNNAASASAAIDVSSSSNSGSLSPSSPRRRLRFRNSSNNSNSNSNNNNNDPQQQEQHQQQHQQHRRGLVNMLRPARSHANRTATSRPSQEEEQEDILVVDSMNSSTRRPQQQKNNVWSRDVNNQNSNDNTDDDGDDNGGGDDSLSCSDIYQDAVHTTGTRTRARTPTAPATAVVVHHRHPGDSDEPPSLVSAMNEPYPRTPPTSQMSSPPPPPPAAAAAAALTPSSHYHSTTTSSNSNINMNINNNAPPPPLPEFQVFSNSDSTTASFEEDIMLDNSILLLDNADHSERPQVYDGPAPRRSRSRSSSATISDSIDTDESTLSYTNNDNDSNNNESSNTNTNNTTQIVIMRLPSITDEPFFPQPSRDYEWMGRSIESLLLGYAVSRAPILQLQDQDDAVLPWESDAESYHFFFRRRSTASTFGGGAAGGGGGGGGRRRSSQGSAAFYHSSGGGAINHNRRGSLSLQQPALSPSAAGENGGGMMHGGTLASYYNMQRRRPTSEIVDRSGGVSGGVGGDRVTRRGSTSQNAPVYRRRGSMASVSSAGRSPINPNATSDTTSVAGGPNVLLHIMARESTGKSCFLRGIPASQCLRIMGGTSLYAALDKPAAGIVTDVGFLAAAIDTGDWAETHSIVSRLVVRLIGDPNNNNMTTAAAGTGMNTSASASTMIEDPNLPPNAPKYYAGGGRLGLERDAFVQAGGIDVLIRMFREKTFCGQEMAYSMDARDLSEEIVATRLAPCWNEALAALRELVYFIPSLVTDGVLDDNGNFLPFLFTLLSHESCFDGAAALIEEILSFMSQTQAQAAPVEGDGGVAAQPVYQPTGRYNPATTFFLGNVPDLYSLWRGFNCRQLAHFCRILALLVFEPEDRQLLESPTVLKSLELLQLRRNRAARAGRDSTVDMNQSILLADQVLIQRLLKLLTVMNYAPPLRQFSPYHVMAHFPFIADTLVMLGLAELEGWNEIDRQDQLARQLLEELQDDEEENNEVLLSDLGTVAEMLEGLSETLMGPNRQATNQIGHIIHVISAAQQAGVIVGRDRSSDRRRNHRRSSRDTDDQSQSEHGDRSFQLRFGDVSVDGTTIQGLASVAGILTDQILANRLSQISRPEIGDGEDEDDQIDGMGNSYGNARRPGQPRYLINTPEDAANSLQFNAMLLGPYQVEVLFVLCTLLGGRRKLDAQDQLNRLGILSILNDMFQRLPWYRALGREAQETNQQDQANQPNGIHGPGCECTPESALCVQYLRLLHNFCDRDCDNYHGRLLLLSDDERKFILVKEPAPPLPPDLRPGLLSKIIAAFIRESDESPYRFWLASCIESYLRGSSPAEQMFAARSGLLDHLVEDITSERLHCAGSLQTSFDLLGELSKGNADVVRLIVIDLDEERFRKLMSVTAANLVDSNVFIRSLLLSLERFTAREGLAPLHADNGASKATAGWTSLVGCDSRSYLTHSWWDISPIGLFDEGSETPSEDSFAARPSDWFPSREVVALATAGARPNSTILPAGLIESVGHFGWVFSPAGDALTANTYLPNTLERLTWFLAANQARLLRDLLGVVDLRNINHENICCLNTAVVIAIFAHRRQQLGGLLNQLRKLNDEEKETKRRALDADKEDDVVDRAFIQAMRYLDLDRQRGTPSYARRASILNSGSQQVGDRMDVMRNFREVLWFWMEYYTNRGRDRLSLEFSSHIRFQEWSHVVSLLAADDGSPTSLVCAPVRLPRSPYQRASRGTENPLRGV